MSVVSPATCLRLTVLTRHYGRVQHLQHLRAPFSRAYLGRRISRRHLPSVNYGTYTSLSLDVVPRNMRTLASRPRQAGKGFTTCVKSLTTSDLPQELHNITMSASSTLHPDITIAEEYERAVTFLRNFHSRRAVTTSTSSSPLGAIDESRSDKSVSTVNLGQSTRIKKTSTSMCLVGLSSRLD
eukprot:scaffold804_cov85-Skeletonema_dohrnii-CCMP3373.AAC.3